MTLRELNARITELYHPAPEQECSLEIRDEQRSESRLPCNETVYMAWTDQEGSRQWARVQLLDRSQDGVGIESSRFVAVGQMVWVELNGVLCRAAVRFMKKHGDRYRGGLFQVRVDQRQSDRAPVAGTGTLQFSGLSTPAIIRNVSANGVQIETAIAVPVPEVVRLSGSTVDCLAITRYCRSQEDHYLIGLQVSPERSDVEPASQGPE